MSGEETNQQNFQVHMIPFFFAAGVFRVGAEWNLLTRFIKGLCEKLT